MKIIVDNYTRLLLTVIAVLLLFVGVGLWYQAPVSPVTPAYGKIPDQGQQLNSIIQKLDDVNNSIIRLENLLVSGKVKVQVVEPSAPAKKTGPAKEKPVKPYDK